MSLEQMRGEAVPERVRPESDVEAALVPRLDERGRAVASGKWVTTRRLGKSHRRAMMGLPDFAEHLEDRFGQRENTFLVSLADDARHHRLRVDRGVTGA